MSTYTKAIEIKNLEQGSGTTITINNKDIALFNIAGTFFAIDNTCPHRGGPLGQGDCEGTKVTCPLHGWQFDVTTGECVLNPAVKVNQYEVKIEGPDVYINI